MRLNIVKESKTKTKLELEQKKLKTEKFVYLYTIVGKRYQKIIKIRFGVDFIKWINPETEMMEVLD